MEFKNGYVRIYQTEAKNEDGTFKLDEKTGQRLWVIKASKDKFTNKPDDVIVGYGENADSDYKANKIHFVYNALDKVVRYNDSRIQLPGNGDKQIFFYTENGREVYGLEGKNSDLIKINKITIDGKTYNFSIGSGIAGDKITVPTREEFEKRVTDEELKALITDKANNEDLMFGGYKIGAKIINPGTSLIIGTDINSDSKIEINWVNNDQLKTVTFKEPNSGKSFIIRYTKEQVDGGSIALPTLEEIKEKGFEVPQYQEFAGWVGTNINGETSINFAEMADKTLTVKWKDILPSEITISGPDSLAVGDKETYTAIISNENEIKPKYKSVQWSADSLDIAQLDQEKGIIFAKKAGKIKLMCTCTEVPSIKAEKSITINDIKATKVTLNENTLSLNTSKNTTATLTATVSPSNTTDKTITWTTADDKIAKVDNTGKVTATGKGTTTIKATCGDVSAECTVTVKQLVTSITISSSGELVVGGTITLKASVLPANANNTAVTWSLISPTDSVESVLTSNTDGTATLMPVSAATYTVKATAKDESGLSNTIELAITATAETTK